MMNSVSTTLPMYPLQVYNYHQPEPDNGLILDLCIKKKTHDNTPEYILRYTSPKQSPNYPDTSSMAFYSQSPSSECSETSDFYELSREADGSPKRKTRRPFKVFPKDPSALRMGIIPTPEVLVQDLDTSYDAFRKRMLAHVQSSNNGCNKNMRRNQNQNEKNMDPTYLEKRRKNNEAAKKSRDARKAKEDEIAIRCAYLEQENLKLKIKVAALESERKKLHNLIYH